MQGVQYGYIGTEYMSMEIGEYCGGRDRGTAKLVTIMEKQIRRLTYSSSCVGYRFNLI